MVAQILCGTHIQSAHLHVHCTHLKLEPLRGLPEGMEDGAPLDHPALQSQGRFPLAWKDPLFGLRGSAPVTVQEWSKGVAVNEEKLDDWSEDTRRISHS